MQQEQFDAHRRHLERVNWVIWTVILCGAAAVGLAVGYLWSFAIGIPLAAVLSFIAYEVWRRWMPGWAKRSWIKRFPELADPSVKWRRW